MKFGTLFSGIGSPELAWTGGERPLPGWQCAWQAEVDPFACWVLHHRWGAGRPQHMPDPEAAETLKERRRRAAAIRHVSRIPEHARIPNYGDVEKVDWNAVEPVDLIAFGSPCQSFSVAGKRLGLDDARGNLALVALRAIARVRPRWVVFENVPGLFSSFSGSELAEGDVRKDPVGGKRDGEEDRDFAAFLTRLRECGYLGCWRVLDAQFAGVPQRRRRVFFVGYLGDWRPPAAVLFEPECLRGDPPPRRQTREDAARAITTGSGGGSHWSSGDAAKNLIAFGIDADCLDRSGEPASGAAADRAGLGVDTETAYAIRARRAGAVALAGTLGANGKAAGSATQQDAESGMLVLAVDPRQITSPDNRAQPSDQAPTLAPKAGPPVAFGGNRQSGAVDVATAVNAHGGPHGRIDFESETFVIQNATRGKDQNGLGVAADGICYTLDQGSQHAVAFKASHFTRGKDGAPSDTTPPLSADADKGDQDLLVLPGVIAPELAATLSRGSDSQGRGSYAGRREEDDKNLVALQAWASTVEALQAPELADPLTAHESRTYTHEGFAFRLRNVVPATPGPETAVRRLTPRECERLQGVPDDFTLVTYRGRPALDGPRYRVLGNAMAGPVVAWIGRRIAAWIASQP